MVDGAAGATGELTHRQRRVLFTRLLCELVLWANGHPGWEIALDEGPVQHQRDCLSTEHGQKFKAYDAVHAWNSFHHLSIAQDLVLYINGEYISDGEHPAWKAIAEKWESMDPACTSGARWRDVNHVSILEGSRDKPLPWLV